MKTAKISLIVLLVVAASLLVMSCDSGSSGTVDGDTVPDGDTDDQTDGDSPDGDDADGDEDVTDGDEEVVNVDEYIEQGIFWMENGEVVFANEVFAQAFELAPDNPQARFGYAFTESMISFEIIGLVVGAVTSATGGDWPQPDTGAKIGAIAPPPPGSYDNWDDWFDQEFVITLDLLADRLRHSVELYGPLKENGGLSMFFTRLPIYVGLNEPTYIRGEIDDADVFMFDMMSRVLAAFMEMMTAHSFKSDIGTVISRVDSSTIENPDANVGSGFLAYLLNYDEGFLGFREDGLERIAIARDLILGALQDVLDAVEAAEAEKADDRDQGDDFFVIEKDRDISDLVMQLWMWNDYREEETQSQITLITAEELQAAVTWSLQIENGGDPVPLDTVVVPLMSALAILPISFGLTDYLGIDLGLEPQLLSPSIISSLLNSFINTDTLALDLNAFFENPKPMRELLPYWTTDQGTWNNDNLIEYECSEEEMANGGPESFFCADKENLQDLPHFVGTQFEIAADGSPQFTPYIAMQDPSFAGMMYVNVAKLEVPNYSVEPEWQMADQLLFNRAVGRVMEKLGSFSGGGSGGK